jgi:hypothetical protein
MSNGALRISDHPTDPVMIACEPCVRRGRLSKTNLITEHGDIPLPDLLARLTAGCAGRASLSQRCHARFPDLLVQKVR